MSTGNSGESWTRRKTKLLHLLTSREIIRLDQVERLLTPRPRKSEWRKLVSEIHRVESQRLLAKKERVALEAALVIGDAWVMGKDRLAWTWRGANDRLDAPKSSIPVILKLDWVTATYVIHGPLAGAAMIMLGIAPRGEGASSKERFLNHLNYWGETASACVENLAPSPALSSMLDRLDSRAGQFPEASDPEEKLKLYKAAKAKYLEEEASKKRFNDLAHQLAVELGEQIQNINEGLNQERLQREEWFDVAISVINAVRLHDRLELVMRKGQQERIWQLHERHGKNEDIFANLVRAACERCYARNPKRRPYPREVLDEMRAKVIWMPNGDKGIAPKADRPPKWNKVVVKSFDDARGKWARDRNIPHKGPKRPPKGMGLPDPED